MLLIIFVEGDTEDKVLSHFLSKWLNEQLPEKLNIRIVNFKGHANLTKDLAPRANMHLNGPRSKELVAVIGLLDLYGPTFFPEELTTVDQKYRWGKQHMEDKVDSSRFRLHFAVHELEAWLLSDPSIFPPAISSGVKEVAAVPETVNCDQPPAKFLNNLYMEKINKGYKKVTEGNRLFAKLDPAIVRDKCPYFKLFTDDLYNLAMEHIKTNKE